MKELTKLKKYLKICLVMAIMLALVAPGSNITAFVEHTTEKEDDNNGNLEIDTDNGRNLKLGTVDELIIEEYSATTSKDGRGERGGWVNVKNYNNYAPQGMPDFNQKQDAWKKLTMGPNGIWDSTQDPNDLLIMCGEGSDVPTIVPGSDGVLNTTPVPDDIAWWYYCGPVTAADVLWWLDSRHEKNSYPDSNSDTCNLISAYPGISDDHDPDNVPQLILDLAKNWVGTSSSCDTTVDVLAGGIQSVLGSSSISASYTVQVNTTDGSQGFKINEMWDWINNESAVILRLYIDDWPTGHFVALNGVNSDTNQIEISDSCFNTSNNLGDSTSYNNANNVSHDIYTVNVNSMQLNNYPGGIVFITHAIVIKKQKKYLDPCFTTKWLEQHIHGHATEHIALYCYNESVIDIEADYYLPNGIDYIPGTATVNGAPSEPIIEDNILKWIILLMNPGEEYHIEFEIEATNPQQAELERMVRCWGYCPSLSTDVYEDDFGTLHIIDFPEGFTITTLADGSSEKDITFTTPGDLVEYLSIPKNATVQLAHMDLTGLGLETGYQSNVIFSDDFNDGDISDWTVTTSGGGIFTVSTNKYVSPPYSVYMKSMASGDRAMGVSPIYEEMNLSKDYNVSFYFLLAGTSNHWFEVFINYHTYLFIHSGTQLQWFDGSYHHIMNLNSDHWYHIDIKVHPSLNTYDIYVDDTPKAICDIYIQSNWEQQFRIGDRNADQQTFDFGEAYWDDFEITQGLGDVEISYPTNPNLDVGNDSDLQWSYSGEFNTTETVPDFSDELNEYLSTCNCGDDNCTVPLVFHSDSAGIIHISNIFIVYTLPFENDPPNQPSQPSGPTELTVGREYTYSTSTADPEGYQVYYQWDWGNEISNWLGPYDSGEPVTANHTWVDQGMFPVKVKAKDINGTESIWSDALVVNLTPTSSNWHGNTRLTNDPSSSKSSSIKTDSFGNVHIVWHDDRDGNFEIYYKKLDNDGNELVSDTRLTNDASSSKYPVIDVDSSNDLHVVWQDDRLFEYEIFYTKLDNNGTTLVNDLQITDTDFARSCFPSLKISNDDNIHLTWQDMRLGSWEVYYKKLDNNGNTIIDDTKISDQEYESLHPSIGVYHDTHPHLTWHADVGVGNAEIFYDDAIIDLIAASISYLSSDPDPKRQYLAQVGVPLTMTATIKNNGDISVSVRVDVYLDETNIWTDDVLIPAGYEGGMSFPWTPTQQGYHMLYVKVDPEGDLDENDISDNVLAKPITIVHPSNVHDHLMIDSYPVLYQDEVIACNRLEIAPPGELTLENVSLIMFGYDSEVFVDSDFIVHDSVITSSHSSEYIQMFEILEFAQNVEIIDCEISQLGGPEGIWIHDSPVVISRTTIKNCLDSAITCEYGSYTFDNLTMKNNGLYDFTTHDGHIDIHDSLFDREKVYLGPTAEFNYHKHLQVTVWDEHGNPADNAFVEIRDAFENLLYSGYTDQNGEIPIASYLVYTQDYSGPTYYSPLNVSAVNQSSFSFGGIVIPGSGLLGTGTNGWDISTHFKTKTKYALLIAGWDKPPGDPNDPKDPGYFDRYAYWNDIEYMYHVLKDTKSYKPENIQVLFMNGTDDNYQQNNKCPINYSANRSNLIKAFQHIGDKIRNDDNHADPLFIFVTDHGGREYNPKTYRYEYSTICMTGGPDVNSSDFDNMIDTYIGDNASKIYIAAGTCYSGGLIKDLHDDNRVVITATGSMSEESVFYWFDDEQDDNPEDGHSFFMVEFISAFHKHKNDAGAKYPCDVLTNSQTDYYLTHSDSDFRYHSNPLQNLNDDFFSRISLHEAFDYALDNDLHGPVDGRVQKGSSRNMYHPQEVDDDVIVIGGLYGNIQIFRYDGDGTFTSTGSVQLNRYIHRIFMDDMNKDRYEDIIVLDGYYDKIKVLLNNGNWTFEKYTYDVGKDPGGLVVADFDGDFYLDVACANRGDDDITILMNNRDGTLDIDNRTDYSVGDEPSDIYGADIDNDWDIDLVVPNSRDHEVIVLFNDGDGNFLEKTSYSTPIHPNHVTLGDIDNDSDSDLLVSTQCNKIAVFKNDGWPNWSAHTITSTADNAVATYAIDLDGDSDIDVLSASEDDDKIAWYENKGGSPPTWQKRTITSFANGAYSVFAVDINNDAYIDVLSASPIDDKIAWYENNGNSPPSWTTHVISTHAFGARSVYAIDLDKDDDIDILSASSTDDRIAWYENDGELSPSWTEHSISTNADGAWCVFAIDLDGDGDNDVLSASLGDDKIAWYENNGAETPSFEEHVVSTNADNARCVYAIDLDSSCGPDILSASAHDDKIAWYRNLGSGSFSSEKIISTDADYAKSVFAIDIDNDGDNDVLSASTTDDKIAWYENDGSYIPNFTTHNITTVADGAVDVFAIDIDNDTDIDVVSASVSDNKITWYEHKGFILTQILTDCDSTVKMCLEDFDGDDLCDLILANSNDDDDIKIFKNMGSCNFSFERSYKCPDYVTKHGPLDFFMTDLDGDEDIDIILPTKYPRAIWSFINSDFNNEGKMEFQRGKQTDVTDITPYAIHGTNHNRPRKWYL